MREITVILSSYNQRTTLVLALEALAKQTSCPAEVIVSDDGSTDGTLEWIDSQPENRYPFPLSYVTSRHCGYNVVKIYNVGLGKASGKRILFSNADVLLSPNSISLHEHLPDDIIGGGEIREICRPASSLIRLVDVVDFHGVERIFEKNKGGYGNSAWFDYLPQHNPCGFWCGNMSVPVQWYEKAGGFNADYSFMYGGEEPEFVSRCMTMGADVSWVHGSIGYHLQHHKKTYAQRQLGIRKFRKDNGFENDTSRADGQRNAVADREPCSSTCR